MEDQDQPKNTDAKIVDVAPAPVEDMETTSENPLIPSVSADESNVDSQPATDIESPVNPTNDGNLPAPAMPTGHKAGGPVLAIVAAVVVALGLAAITVYAYMKMQNENKPTTTQTENNNQTEAAPTEAVDDATKDVDDAIDSSDQSEFDEAELSDESLGL